ncbi:hypothetical protein BDN72DRAFT_966041 [Pluteus cervinus]|uniref:Uncharacterized protein n=1 Tax=Pluteus cervinus TaxID=181527 RepID=A0ACD3A1V7_9AGAR|nr:hypothetical protein BDN72DRAFT_966041 [Pluteus cervinus]
MSNNQRPLPTPLLLSVTTTAATTDADRAVVLDISPPLASMASTVTSPNPIRSKPRPLPTPPYPYPGRNTSQTERAGSSTTGTGTLPTQNDSNFAGTDGELELSSNHNVIHSASSSTSFPQHSLLLGTAPSSPSLPHAYGVQQIDMKRLLSKPTHPSYAYSQHPTSPNPSSAVGSAVSSPAPGSEEALSTPPRSRGPSRSPSRSSPKRRGNQRFSVDLTFSPFGAGLNFLDFPPTASSDHGHGGGYVSRSSPRSGRAHQPITSLGLEAGNGQEGVETKERGDRGKEKEKLFLGFIKTRVAKPDRDARVGEGSGSDPSAASASASPSSGRAGFSPPVPLIPSNKSMNSDYSYDRRDGKESIEKKQRNVLRRRPSALNTSASQRIMPLSSSAPATPVSPNRPRSISHSPLPSPVIAPPSYMNLPHRSISTSSATSSSNVRRKLVSTYRKPPPPLPPTSPMLPSSSPYSAPSSPLVFGFPPSSPSPSRHQLDQVHGQAQGPSLSALASSPTGSPSSFASHHHHQPTHQHQRRDEPPLSPLPPPVPSPTTKRPLRLQLKDGDMPQNSNPPSVVLLNDVAISPASPSSKLHTGGGIHISAGFSGSPGQSQAPSPHSVSPSSPIAFASSTAPNLNTPHGDTLGVSSSGLRPPSNKKSSTSSSFGGSPRGSPLPSPSVRDGPNGSWNGGNASRGSSRSRRGGSEREPSREREREKALTPAGRIMEAYKNRNKVQEMGETGGRESPYGGLAYDDPPSLTTSPKHSTFDDINEKLRTSTNSANTHYVPYSRRTAPTISSSSQKSHSIAHHRAATEPRPSAFHDHEQVLEVNFPPPRTSSRLHHNPYGDVPRSASYTHSQGDGVNVNAPLTPRKLSAPTAFSPSGLSKPNASNPSSAAQNVLMSLEPQRAPASKRRDREKEREREEEMKMMLPPAKLTKSKLKIKEKERDVGRTTFDSTDLTSTHSSSTHSHSHEQEPTRHYHKVHPSVSSQGHDATPYYTVLGSTSGRVVAVGGPEDSWSNVGFANPLQLLGQGKKDRHPPTQLHNHAEVEGEDSGSNDGHLARRYVAESLGWKASSGGGVEHAKELSERSDKPGGLVRTRSIGRMRTEAEPSNTTTNSNTTSTPATTKTSSIGRLTRKLSGRLGVAAGGSSASADSRGDVVVSPGRRRGGRRGVSVEGRRTDAYGGIVVVESSGDDLAERSPNTPRSAIGGSSSPTRVMTLGRSSLQSDREMGRGRTTGRKPLQELRKELGVLKDEEDRMETPTTAKSTLPPTPPSSSSKPSKFSRRADQHVPPNIITSSSAASLQPPAPTTTTPTISPGPGASTKLWKLVKRLSAGGLRDKFAEGGSVGGGDEAPPVPAIRKDYLQMIRAYPPPSSAALSAPLTREGRSREREHDVVSPLVSTTNTAGVGVVFGEGRGLKSRSSFSGGSSPTTTTSSSRSQGQGPRTASGRKLSMPETPKQQVHAIIPQVQSTGSGLISGSSGNGKPPPSPVSSSTTDVASANSKLFKNQSARSSTSSYGYEPAANEVPPPLPPPHHLHPSPSSTANTSSNSRSIPRTKPKPAKLAQLIDQPIISATERAQQVDQESSSLSPSPTTNTITVPSKPPAEWMIVQTPSWDLPSLPLPPRKPPTQALYGAKSRRLQEEGRWMPEMDDTSPYGGVIFDPSETDRPDSPPIPEFSTVDPVNSFKRPSPKTRRTKSLGSPSVPAQKGASTSKPSPPLPIETNSPISPPPPPPPPPRPSRSAQRPSPTGAYGSRMLVPNRRTESETSIMVSKAAIAASMVSMTMSMTGGGGQGSGTQKQPHYRKHRRESSIGLVSPSGSLSRPLLHRRSSSFLFSTSTVLSSSPPKDSASPNFGTSKRNWLLGSNTLKFREIGEKKGEKKQVLTEDEKAARWDDLLEFSAKVGGTIHLHGGGDVTSLPSDQISISASELLS